MVALRSRLEASLSIVLVSLKSLNRAKAKPKE